MVFNFILIFFFKFKGFIYLQKNKIKDIGEFIGNEYKFFCLIYEEEHILELEYNYDITKYSYEIEKSDKNNNNKYEKKRKKKEKLNVLKTVL